MKNLDFFFRFAVTDVAHFLGSVCHKINRIIPFYLIKSAVSGWFSVTKNRTFKNQVSKKIGWMAGRRARHCRSASWKCLSPGQWRKKSCVSCSLSSLRSLSGPTFAERPLTLCFEYPAARTLASSRKGERYTFLWKAGEGELWFREGEAAGDRPGSQTDGL